METNVQCHLFIVKLRSRYMYHRVSRVIEVPSLENQKLWVKRLFCPMETLTCLWGY